MRWYNPIMSWLLRSPLNGIMGNNLMLITVRGRKSGRPYTTPVNYIQDGNTLWITSRRERTWWRNLRQCAPVEMVLDGMTSTGIGKTIEDADTIAATLGEVLSRTPQLSRYYGIRLDEAGRPRAEDCTRAAQSLVLIRVDLS